jgi:thiamine kinase-like enzyme
LGLDILATTGAYIGPAEIVPTHTDPNLSNIIVANGTVVIVDWDGITLSDRMRDFSLLLWRYIAKPKWQDFFDAYELAFDVSEQARFYWWLARDSLSIALWFARQDDSTETQKYVDDYHAAVEHLRVVAQR